MLVAVLFFTKGIENHLPEGWRVDGLLEWGKFDYVKGQTMVVRLPGWVDGTLSFLVRYSGAFIFWFITYIRLKEKEI